MTSTLPGVRKAVLVFLCALMAALASPAIGAERAVLAVSLEAGFGRMILTFPDRDDLPANKVRLENGVAAIEFEEPIDFVVPDVAAVMSDYVGAARIDPDARGVRFGMRGPFLINSMEAGERLFVDFLPPNWQGLPPGLPEAVVAELAERARDASIRAEQRRKAEDAETLKPVAKIRIGRNPTFYRLQFEWSEPTEGRFAIEEGVGNLDFDWPVPVDLAEVAVDLPEQVLGVTNSVSPDGSRIAFKLGEGVVPRFYALSENRFVLDVDIGRDAGLAAVIAVEEARTREQQEIATALAEAQAADRAEAEAAELGVAGASIGPVTPTVSLAGATVRITFPFDEDIPAAVFRRGSTVWMLFDTPRQINAPAQSEALSSVASDFTVDGSGETRIVRMTLSDDRLATLGSEGRSWVLSLGDVLLNPTVPVALKRQRDGAGRFLMTADLERPGRVHVFRDPIVGDELEVVTIYPPARGVARTLNFVDFSALRSVHGLVLRPQNERLEVGIDGRNAVIATPEGLALSPVETMRAADTGMRASERAAFVDLVALREDDPERLVERREELIARAASTEGRARELARLELAQFYAANRFAYEAIGVLKVLEGDLRSEELRRKLRLTRGIADVLAGRPADALKILNSETYNEESDALLWRAWGRAETGDFIGARLDAIAAEGVIDSYPGWVGTSFLLAGARAAIETADGIAALRFLERLEVAALDPEQVTHYQLLQARLAELEKRDDEALDGYGQVIAADVRPTRAEAVYRTLMLLDRIGKIDVERAIATLAAEVMLWRGNRLEADMQKLLAELYFRNSDYRLGFETVREAAAHHPDNEAINALVAQAQTVFDDLYLNGGADRMSEVDALALYYDFHQLTPPGSRGDEMIRNLARRLVKADLLTPAADLLEYQIDSRLKGAAMAQIAADLAIIRIADRDPEGALRVLARTRIAELPPQLERQRRVLEARALIDAGREVLAIDLLSRVEGRDADLLRVDGYWQAKNYVVAGELIEAMYSPGATPGPLTQPARMDIIKGAVGFVLGGDLLGLSRLRSKFGEAMAQAPEWGMFDFVTSTMNGPQTVEFRRVARVVSGLDSLNAFLTAYRETYPASEGIMPARAAETAGA